MAGVGTVNTSSTSSADDEFSVEGSDSLELREGESTESLALRVIRIFGHIMENNREAMFKFFEILSNGDKRKAEYMMDILEKNLKQLKKASKAKGLKIFMKILSVFALILASLAVLVNPTPFGVAMLAVAIAMFVEPMVADAAGYDSLINTAFKEMFEVLKDMGMPVWAAAILMAVVVIVLVLVSAYGLAALGKLLADVGGKTFQTLSGISAGSSSAAVNSASTSARATVEAISKFLTDLMAWLKTFGTENLKNIIFAADMVSLTASSGGEFAQGVIKFDVAKSQIDIDKLMAFVDMIVQGLDLTREDAIEFKKMIKNLLIRIQQMDLL